MATWGHYYLNLSARPRTSSPYLCVSNIFLWPGKYWHLSAVDGMDHWSWPEDMTTLAVSRLSVDNDNNGGTHIKLSFYRPQVVIYGLLLCLFISSIQSFVLPGLDLLLQLLPLMSNHSGNAFNFNNSDSSSSCRIELREDSQSIWASVLATKLIPTLKQCWIKYPKMIIITSTDKDQPRMMMTGKKNQFPVFRRRLSHVNSNCYIS